MPHASYSERAWKRWIFECCRNVENHELGEWFKVAGVRVFAPLHGPGENPYDVRELVSDEEARTDQRGHIEPRG